MSREAKPSRSIPVLLALVPLFLLGSLQPVPAKAAVAHCTRPYNPVIGMPGWYFDGWASNFPGHDPNSLLTEGSSGWLTTQFAWVCSSDYGNGGSIPGRNNFTYAWVMEESADTPSTNWSQSGYGRWYGLGCMIIWAEQTIPSPRGAFVDKYGSCLADGENHHYWNEMTYEGGCWCMHANFDSTRLLTQTTTAFAFWAGGWGSQPFNFAYSAETKHPESDVPGTPGAQIQWTSLQVQRYIDDTWMWQPCGLGWTWDSSRWSQSWGRVSCHDNLNVWTSGYTGVGG